MEPGELTALTDSMMKLFFSALARRSRASRHGRAWLELFLSLTCIVATACSATTRHAAGAEVMSGSGGELQVEANGHWLSFRGQTRLWGYKVFSSASWLSNVSSISSSRMKSGEYS